jgi:hypothetical protein
MSKPIIRLELKYNIDTDLVYAKELGVKEERYWQVLDSKKDIFFVEPINVAIPKCIFPTMKPTNLDKMMTLDCFMPRCKCQANFVLKKVNYNWMLFYYCGSYSNHVVAFTAKVMNNAYENF